MKSKNKKPEDDSTEKVQSMDLTVPMTIRELIDARAAIIFAWNEHNRTLNEVDVAFGRIYDKSFYFNHPTNGRSQHEPFDVDAMTHSLDYSLFVFALDKLNITRAMTEHARDVFLEKIKASKTIFDETQLTGLAQNAHEMFRDSSLNTVREVYRQLIGVSYRGGDWGSGKKDNLQKVEKVFRIGYSDLKLERTWNGSVRLSITYFHAASSYFHFNDLLTACRLIEGEGFTDYTNNFRSIVYAIKDDRTSIDCGYFTVQGFLNGNCKVHWNNDKMNVLDRLNAIGSGIENDLPDIQRKRYKASHFYNDGVPDPLEYFKVNPEFLLKNPPNDEKDFAFFPTPDRIAGQMVELAEYGNDGSEDSMITLDPSAGMGSLLKYAPGVLYAIEFNHHRANKLRGDFKNTIEADFLAWESGGLLFDRVLMNPPFSDRNEPYHIIKAFGLLKPNGILVAILPEGWFTRDDLKSRVFRRFLKDWEHKPNIILDSKTFAKTQVKTRIVTLKRLVNE